MTVGDIVIEGQTFAEVTEEPGTVLIQRGRELCVLMNDGVHVCKIEHSTWLATGTCMFIDA